MKFLIRCGDYRDEYRLQEGSTIVGSSRNCRLVLDFPGVEPRHAQCYHDGKHQVVLKALASQAPVLVNGQPVDRAELRPYDEIRVGEVSVTFLPEESVEAVPPAEDGLEAGSPAGGISFDEAPDDTTHGPDHEPLSFPPAPRAADPSGISTEGRPTELIQREGRWILRDLVTGREIEISPVEAAARGAEVDGNQQPSPTEVEATPMRPEGSLAPQGRRRMPMLAALVCVALAVCAIAAIYVSLKDRPRDPASLHAEHDRELRTGFAFLMQDKFDRARGHFKKAASLLPESKLPDILFDVAELEAGKGKGYESFRWNAAGALYEELERHPDASAEMREHARRRAAFVTTYKVHRNVVQQARDLAELGKFVEAYDKTKSIPAESPVGRQNASWIETTKTEAFKALLDGARVAHEERKWTLAVNLANRAGEIVPRSAAVDMSLTASRRARLAETRVAEARKLYQATDKLAEKPDEACTALKEALTRLRGNDGGNVFARTPLEAEGEGLAREIRYRLNTFAGTKAKAEILMMFRRGEGPAALEALSKQADTLPPDALAAKPGIQRVVQLFERARQFDEDKQYEAARELWKSLLAEVPDKQNAYHQQALARSGWYQENAGEIAGEYWKWAMNMIDDNPSKARQFLNAALNWDPKSEKVTKAVSDLDKKAELHFRLGYTLSKEDKEKARLNYEKALKYAAPDSELGIKSARELRKLDGH